MYTRTVLHNRCNYLSLGPRRILKETLSQVVEPTTAYEMYCNVAVSA